MAPPYLGSVTGTFAGNLITATATRSPTSRFVAFQFNGTFSRAHWNPSKQSV